MKIGIDLSSLQGAHRMRGIGYTLINLINSISDQDKKNNSFVFYFYEADKKHPDPLKLLNLNGVNYEVRYIQPFRRIQYRLAGRLGIFTGLANQILELKDLYIGDSRIKDLRDIEYFLQTDQSQCLPKRQRNTKLGLIIYDIIPYVLEWDYLWSYRVCRIKGLSRKASARKHIHRLLYAHKIRTNTLRAHDLISISQHTKKDFVKFLSVRSKKITVVPLGVSPAEKVQNSVVLMRYIQTTWGYLPKPYKFNHNTPYILFVGGADSRRKLDDLVAAYNQLKASGSNVKLLLSGDSMQGANHIATDKIRNALLSSSYQDDIIYLGFTDDETRDWLYANCLCFVFPSRYEGFGLPVLEAIVHGCPVICYDNEATHEVAQELPIYANNPKEIVDGINKLLELDDNKLNKIRSEYLKHAQNYSWGKTTNKIMQIVTKDTR